VIESPEPTNFPFDKGYCRSASNQSRSGEENFPRSLENEKCQFMRCPHEVTVAGEEARGADSHELLKGMTTETANQFAIIITTDCIWSYWPVVHSSEWSTYEKMNIFLHTPPSRPVGF
jgi:hypothetical protein